MGKVAVGKKVDNFSAPSTDGDFKLSDQVGKYVVLYFYPKDNTPGCTQEGQDFRQLYNQFQESNAKIFGISRDSLESHQKFKSSQEFPFDLLSDTEQNVCELFDVLDVKNAVDKASCSMIRTTFVIDPAGVLIREWRGVKVANHVQEVLEFINSKQ